MSLRISNIKQRIFSVLLVTVLLLSAMPALTVSAANASDNKTSDFYIEPTVTTADDHTYAVTALNLYVKNPDALKLSLTVSVGTPDTAFTDNALTAKEPDSSDWITVNELSVSESESAESGEDSGEGASKPTFVIDFHTPAKETSETSKSDRTPPAFLRETEVGGVGIYALQPGYEISFHVVGGNVNSSGKYPLDYTETYLEDKDGIVSFDIERPQKLVATLTQNEDENGTLSTYYYYPESIRDIADALKNDKAAFLKKHGVSDATLYIQYDFSRLDTQSPSPADEESDRTSLWGTEYLTVPAIMSEESDAETGYFGGASFSFGDEAFRSRFSKGTFTETKASASSTAGASGYWRIQSTKTTLTARARFVLALTDATDTTYYSTSQFTDPFSVGASNSHVTQPSELRTPEITSPVFESNKDGDALLSFYVKADPTLLDAGVWRMAFGGADADLTKDIGHEIEISINGSDWEVCNAEVTSDSVFADGEWKLTLSDEDLNEYAYIRLRMRYTAVLSEDTVLQSEWSDAIAFDKKPAETVTEPESVNTIPIYTETDGENDDVKYICPLCGFCPAPWGVCLFLWIGAALLILLIVVLVVLLIPKKKPCPRCQNACSLAEKICPVCGYRFVGAMPLIEDTTGDINVVKAPGASDEDFFAAMSRKEGIPTVENATDALPLQKEKQTDAPEAVAAKPATEPSSDAAPTADAAFLAELKRKIAATKAGQKQTFTPAEIAYIRALKEKKAQVTAASTPSAPSPAPAKAESREAQIARLRALREKELSASDKAELDKSTPKRDETPTKQIKCPMCAVMNDATNTCCYICGGELPKQ